MNKETSATPETQTQHIESPTRESAMSFIKCEGALKQPDSPARKAARLNAKLLNERTMSPVTEEKGRKIYD